MLGERDVMIEDQTASGPRSVDILIVSYNTSEILGDCLRSIDAHRPPRDQIALQIRVFDNASSDDTAEMVRRDFPEVLLRVSDANVGFGRANNALAGESRAEFLLLLNSDTVWTCDIVSPLLAELDSRPTAALAGPRLVFPDGRPQPSSQRLPSLTFEFAAAVRGTKLSLLPLLRRSTAHVSSVVGGDVEAREARATGFLWATCWLLKREYVQQHGLFDERFPLYDEDLDFCRRLTDTGFSALYVPTVELIHLGGASSAPLAKLHAMRSGRARYYRHNDGALAALVYKYLVGGLWRIRLADRVSTPRGG
jgi:N-acetylglucosaminyl-diphospho-decaprenol L-rhamnosyltransferase